jgi:SAM-dependent methyltransferase
MKTPDEVGRDFNEYAKAWADQGYGLEVEWTGDGIVRAEGSDEVQRPGDEWGSPDALRSAYAGLIQKYGLRDSVNVVEIGAGGGRSTQVLLDLLGDAAADYHVIDVAEVFVETLRQRISRPLDIHIVSDVDTSFLPKDSIDFVLAQSSWSHISFYDQYRYLRDLRFAMKKGAPIVVSGLFVIGTGDDWTWNRYRRRVYQVDHRIDGVFHEFTSVSLLAEMLHRLGYTDIVIFNHGFTARRGKLIDDQFTKDVANMAFRYVPTLPAWLAGDKGVLSRVPVPLPTPRPEPKPLPTRAVASIKRRTKRLFGG